MAMPSVIFCRESILWKPPEKSFDDNFYSEVMCNTKILTESIDFEEKLESFNGQI